MAQSALDKYRTGQAPAGSGSALDKYRTTPVSAPAAAPTEAPSLATRAKDVAIGAGKGLAQEAVGVVDTLGPLINKMANASFGPSPARADAPTASDLLGLHASNPDQQKGKYAEAALSILSPFAVSKGRAMVEAGKAAAARRVVETTARQMPPLAEASSNVARQMPRLIPETATKAGKATTLTDALQEALDAARKPEAPSVVSGAPAKTITTAGNPATTAAEYDELVKNAQGRTAARTGSPAAAKMDLTKSAKIADTGEGSSKLGELLDAIHGEEAPSKGNGTYTEGAFNKFAEMMGSKGAKIDEAVDSSLKAGKVTEAATTIEQKVKLTVNELAEKMRARYGSQRAGKMLQPNQPAKVGGAQIKRLAPGPSKTPEIVEEARAASDFSRRIADPKGGINPYVVASAGGGAAGAAAGATQGDTDSERFTNAVIGGTAGAVIVPLLAHAVASGSTEKLKNAWFSALLARPGPVIRAYLGGVGGAAAAAHDLALAGKTHEAGVLMKDLFSGAFVDGIIASAKKGGASSMLGTGADFGSDAPTLVGRVYNAVNEPAMRAMLKAGVSREDAMRYTLAGVPRTKGGQVILNAWNQWFPLKAMGSMFPRVGVQVVEHGLERMGVKTAGVNGLNQGVSAGVRAGRALTGAGTAVAAYEGADRVPTWAQPYLTALSGVYALPVGIGLAVGKAKGSGGDQITAGLDAVNQYSPFPKYGPTEAAKQIVTGAAFVPGVVADAARAKDPYERQTARQAAGFFARTKARIPGLRETLPIKGQNVNIAGVPNQDRSSAVTRFMSAASSQQDKLQDVPAAVVGELQRLNVPINAPSFDKSIKIGSREIALPPDVAERARAERRQQLLPRVEKLIASPNYQRADDTRKKRMLETAISRAEAVGSQQARASIVKTLRSQGALRGSR